MAKSNGQELGRLEKVARAQGWRVERTSNGHVVFYSPDKTVAPVVTGGTPSDHRAYKNCAAMLRRAGLKEV